MSWSKPDPAPVLGMAPDIWPDGTRACAGVQERLNTLRSDREKEELAECTFRPSINASSLPGRPASAQVGCLPEGSTFRGYRSHGCLQRGSLARGSAGLQGESSPPPAPTTADTPTRLQTLVVVSVMVGSGVAALRSQAGASVPAQPRCQIPHRPWCSLLASCTARKCARAWQQPCLCQPTGMAPVSRPVLRLIIQGTHIDAFLYPQFGVFLSGLYWPLQVCTCVCRSTAASASRSCTMTPCRGTPRPSRPRPGCPWNTPSSPSSAPGGPSTNTWSPLSTPPSPPATGDLRMQEHHTAPKVMHR